MGTKYVTIPRQDEIPLPWADLATSHFTGQPIVADPADPDWTIAERCLLPHQLFEGWEGVLESQDRAVGGPPLQAVQLRLDGEHPRGMPIAQTTQVLHLRLLQILRYLRGGGRQRREGGHQDAHSPGTVFLAQ